MSASPSPGVVRSRDGLVETAPNLGWTGVPLGSRLAARLDLDVPVLVANEADVGVLAEHRRGAAAGIDDVLYIHGEVGVGGGLIVGGRPLEGAAGYAGEVGHLPVVPDGAPCRCGSFGCWETEIGTHALLARAGIPIDAGQEGVDRRVPGCGSLATPSPSPRSRRRPARSGSGLAGLVNIFNPRLVVLGGLCGRIHAYASDAIWRRAGPAESAGAALDGARRPVHARCRRSAHRSSGAGARARPFRSRSSIRGARRPCRAGKRLTMRHSMACAIQPPLSGN